MATEKQIASLAKARAAKKAAKAKASTSVEPAAKFQTDNIPLNMPHIARQEEAVRPTIDPTNNHPITRVPHARMTVALEHEVARAADNLCTGTDVKLLRLVHEWIQAKGTSSDWIAEVLSTTTEVVDKLFLEASILLGKGLLYGNYKPGTHVMQGKGKDRKRQYVPGTDDSFREKYYARAGAITQQRKQQQDIEFSRLHRV